MLTRYEAADAFAALLLAHGAGAGQRHPFLVGVAERLAARGLAVATFDFEYMAAGKKRPDPAPRLEARATAALDEARAWAGALPCLAGGKSMGGRIVTQVAARVGAPLGLAGVVLLGYPLHPPKQPAKLRAAHLASVPCPMLFVQGARDAFGGPDELAPHLAGAPPGTRVHPVAEADHGFAVPKRAGDPAAVIDAIADAVAAFARERAAASAVAPRGCPRA